MPTRMGEASTSRKLKPGLILVFGLVFMPTYHNKGSNVINQFRGRGKREKERKGKRGLKRDH